MRSERTRRRRLGALTPPAAVCAVVLGLLGAGAAVWQSSSSAFQGTSASAANSWAAGQVSLTDDDGGVALFTATGLKPGATGQKCITVTYGGNVASGEVRILGAPPSGTLGAHITLDVAVGPTGGACAALPVSATPISGAPLTTIGTRTTYAAGYSTGWSPQPGDSRVFRFTYTLSPAVPDDQAGATCAITVTWETQS